MRFQESDNYTSLYLWDAVLSNLPASNGRAVVQCGVRLFLSRTLMKFVTFTDHQSGPDLLCDDFPAKVSLYLLLTIEHSDIFDL